MLPLLARLGLVVTLLQGQPSPKPHEALLHVGDELTVVVAGQKDYTGPVLVLTDGTVTGRGFDHIKVEGKTLAQAKALIKAQLQQIFADPGVSVLLSKPRPLFVYVSGALTSPTGPVIWTPGETLRQLVASVTLPGSPNQFNATLTRADGTKRTVDLDRLLLASDPTQDEDLEPGAVLAIEPKARMRVWLDGMVNRAGEMRVEEGTDAYQLIAEMGGLRSDTITSNVASFTEDEIKIVIRRGERSIILPARFDPKIPKQPLKANDLVIVETPKLIRVSVGGQVQVPGQYELIDGASVPSAVFQARGIIGDGTLRTVIVTRGTESYSVDASQLETGSSPSPFPLQNGDMVYVRRNDRAILVLGEVTAPGRYLIPDGLTWNATDALAAAHGVGGGGTMRRVTLVRPDATGHFVATKFNIDEFLKDGKGSANPKLLPGDILLFGQPKGITLSSVNQILGFAVLINTLVHL